MIDIFRPILQHNKAATKKRSKEFCEAWRACHHLLTNGLWSCCCYCCRSKTPWKSLKLVKIDCFQNFKIMAHLKKRCAEECIVEFHVWKTTNMVWNNAHWNWCCWWNRKMQRKSRTVVDKLMVREVRFSAALTVHRHEEVCCFLRSKTLHVI